MSNKVRIMGKESAIAPGSVAEIEEMARIDSENGGPMGEEQ
jgi:hypothetical protein